MTTPGHRGGAKQADLPPVAVLGIDAAWTLTNPSGVSLWRRFEGKWKCLRAAANYHEFSGAGQAELNVLDVQRLLGTCAELLSDLPCPVVAIAVDMPLANEPILGRREADSAISRKFGDRGCSTHSPTPTRPGLVSDKLVRDFSVNGFPLTCSYENAGGTSLIEVYPHVSLLAISDVGPDTDRPYVLGKRLPYKVGKSSKYWPGVPLPVRRQSLVKVWKDILLRLGTFVDLTAFPIPENTDGLTNRELKSLEDQIDALICAWSAAQYVENAMVPIGSEHSAIWIPKMLLK